MYMEWKWTKGEPYERSARTYDNEINRDKNTGKEKEIEISAYTSSLNHDEYTWDLLNQQQTNEFQPHNKREELDSKISDRELVQQCGINPFMSDTNYADDVSTRDAYLKPVNTTSDKIKPAYANE